MTGGNSVTRDFVSDVALLEALDDAAEPPHQGYDRPVYIAQGTADVVVPAATVELLAEALCAANEELTFTLYEGATHRGVLATSFADTLPWVDSLFQGDVPAGNCGS